MHIPWRCLRCDLCHGSVYVRCTAFLRGRPHGRSSLARWTAVRIGSQCAGGRLQDAHAPVWSVPARQGSAQLELGYWKRRPCRRRRCGEQRAASRSLHAACATRAAASRAISWGAGSRLPPLGRAALPGLEHSEDGCHCGHTASYFIHAVVGLRCGTWDRVRRSGTCDTRDMRHVIGW